MVITFAKPLNFEGKEYTEIDVNLDDLTGQNMIDASHETRSLGEKAPILEFSKVYQAVIAAKAAKVPFDLIIALPAKEFAKATIQVQNFLIE